MTTTRHILVVEDDEDIRACVVEVLESSGFSVSAAGNGQEALAAIGERWPALILLDMMMPLMDGWAFMEELQRRALAGIPIVVFSAVRNLRQSTMAIAPKAILGKPLPMDVLVAAVDRWAALAG